MQQQYFCDITDLVNLVNNVATATLLASIDDILHLFVYDIIDRNLQNPTKRSHYDIIGRVILLSYTGHYCGLSKRFSSHDKFMIWFKRH